jgi:hypothetical protein
MHAMWRARAANFGNSSSDLNVDEMLGIHIISSASHNELQPHGCARHLQQMYVPVWLLRSTICNGNTGRAHNMGGYAAPQRAIDHISLHIPRHMHEVQLLPTLSCMV